MIEAIIFDLDGVLTDTKMIHYEALNLALPEDKRISLEDHYNKYDGLSTSKKLEMIFGDKSGNVPSIVFDIEAKKQVETIRLIKEKIVPVKHIAEAIHKLSEKYQLFCCSNAVSTTVAECLDRLGIYNYFQQIYSNECVTRNKPHPAIFLQCMAEYELNPKYTLIIEDSINGKKAALDSGAHLMAVYSPDDVTYDNVTKFITSMVPNTSVGIEGQKWVDSKLNVVVPMAGLGSRFANAGYTFPKPLIEVFGKPMIQQVVENLNIDAHYIYILQKAHRREYNIDNMLRLLTPNCDIVEVVGLTEGAACSVLTARHLIDNDNPILIANSDQLTEWDSSKFMYQMVSKGVDGGILTFPSMHPKWSYARVENGRVVEVAEKNPISNHATVGVYYMKHGSDFVKYADQMIAKNLRVNNEFYVCPVFNEFIADNKNIVIYPVNKMWGIGTPEDLEYYIREHQ